MEKDVEIALLSPTGHRAVWGLAVIAAILMTASGLGWDLGLPTCLTAVAAVLLTTEADLREVVEIVRDVSWSVIPLVAGLFVLVEALNGAGALETVGGAMNKIAALPPLAGSLAASFGAAGLSNVMNNLPSGLLTGGALQSMQLPAHLRHAVLIGVDLGPNLSVTGSLATILWLIALRREGQQVSAWAFLKLGVLVMPLALLLATVALALLTN